MDIPSDMNVDIRSQQDLIQSRCVHPTGTFIRFKKEEIEQSISDRFEQQVEKYPHRLAVRTSRHELTYEELNRVSNRLAQAILAQRREGEEPLALLLEYGALVPVGIMAALKTGRTYVPLDPTYPKARNKYMLEDSQAALVVTDNQNLSLARELSNNSVQLVNIDEIDPGLPADNPGLSISPGTIAYILYTSGSTGQPKGVFSSHRNLLHHIRRYTNGIHICAEDRLALLRSFSFNGALKDIYGSLLNGASLFPFNLKTEGVMNLANWMMQQEITVSVSVSTAFRQFVNTLTGKEKFPKLRVVYVGGEEINRMDIELYKEHFHPDCIFIHGLGTSETGTARRYFIDKNTQITDSRIPVGYPVEDMEILLLDKDGRNLGFNQVGGIAVRSQYIALGYWRKPEQTQRAFLPDPAGGSERTYLTGDLGMMMPNGCLFHLGREDFQVKVRGHRIEATAVETALVALDTIKEVAVVAREDQHGDQILVAYLVPTGQQAPTVTELRRTLAESLPEYMIPSVFVTLDALPLTPDGKTDRRTLPKPDITRPDMEADFVEPRSDMESQLRETWEEVLGVHPIGVQDNFFDLGGHSLVASRLLIQIQKVFGRTFPLSIFLQTPTVEQMANVLQQKEWSPSRSSLVAIQSEGPRPPFFAIHACGGEVMFYAGLARHLGSEQPFYGLRAQGLTGDEIPHTRIEDMAAHYVREIQTVQPEGPYYLGGGGVGGMIAFEMAQQLLTQGQEMGLLVLMDTGPPRPISSTSSTSGPGKSLGHYIRRSFHHLRSGQMLNILKYVFRKHREKIALMFLPPRNRRVRKAMDAVPWSYVPQVYPGRIIYFLSEKRRKSTTDLYDPIGKWRELASGGLDIYVIPGKHLGMLRKPHVRVIADQLKACLDAVQANVSSI